MAAGVAIAVYRCEVAGKPTDSLDIQVRHFDSFSPSAIEQRLREELLHSYTNDAGETVTWPLVHIVSIEPVDNPPDGAEIAGFITGCNEFPKWSRPA
jgi:hypothetical protein